MGRNPRDEFVHPFSRFGKILGFALGFCALAFTVANYLLDVGYADDRARLLGNHPVAAEAFSPLGNAEPNLPLQMQLRFALRNQAVLDKLLADQQNPASADYHKWLKTGEFHHCFGPKDSEIEAVVAWLKSEGFSITNRHPGYLEFNGTVAQAQRTFEVRIAKFGDGTAYANTSDPIVPQKFANVIGAILGMDNMVHAVPVTHPVSTARQEQPVQLAQAEDSAQESLKGPIGGAIVGGIESFGPSDIRTFYDETVGTGQDGTGDCIAIVGVSDFLDAAMSTFTSQFNLPSINYSREIHGTNPGIVSSGEAEAELDLQWAHAAAPGASIVFHLGSDLVSDISGAVSDNACGAISISFAFCGPSSSLINNTMDPLFKQAASQGQTVFVSSGDDGAAGLSLSGNSCVVNTSRSVNEMSADPYVTSVGGTQFTPAYSSGNDVGHTAESVWNDGSGSGGGGASQFFTKPSYQTGSGVPADGARDVPDISLIASPGSPGVFWGHDAGSGNAAIACCIGGTSLSAPIWAGFSRVIAQLSGDTRLGSLNPLIYSLANTEYDTAGFRDVTSGNNNYNSVTGFSAGPGYDQASGWGTIDFNTFASAAKTWIAAQASATPTSTVSSTPTATATRTATATPTKTATATSTATSTATTTRTATATQTATATTTPTATATPTSTATGTAVPTATLTATSTPTATHTATVTQTATGTPTPTLTATSTATATSSATSTPTASTTATATQSATATQTATATSTSSAPATPTSTATATSSLTGTPTATTTATSTATATQTASASPSATASASATATSTTTSTPTPTITSTATVTATPTPTQTASDTATATPGSTPTATTTISATTTPTATATTVPTETVTTTTTPTPTLDPTSTPTPVSEPTGGTLSVPAALRFPATGVGMPPMSRNVIIHNRSASSALAVEVGTLAQPFVVSGSGQYSLAPAGSATVTIVFSPDTVGMASQTLPITSGDPKHPHAGVVISGMVRAGKLSAPAKVALSASSGSMVTKTVTLRNSGKGMLSGTVPQFATGSPFTLVGAPVSFSLAPGQTQPVTIEFAPMAAGPVSTSLAIDSTPPPATKTMVVTGSAH